MTPAWKGSDQISTLVSKNSHFLIKEGQEEHEREEIVILGPDGEFRRVLSKDWPDKSGEDAEAPENGSSG